MSADAARRGRAPIVDPRPRRAGRRSCVVALLGLIVLGNALSPFFLTAGNFANLLAALMEVAIMALPMTLIIIAGEIDLSVESMAGLASADPRLPVGGRRPDRDRDRRGPRRRRARRPAERPARRARRAAVARRDPRHARAVPRPRPDHPRAARASATSRRASPSSASATCPGRYIPWPFVIFLALAAHPRRRPPPDVDRPPGLRRSARTPAPPASRASASTRVKIGLFVLSGLIAALAGVILTSRLSSARADAGQGMTLTVVTVVLLGGVNIFGGSGHDPGRRPGRARRGGHAERPAPRQRVGRGPEHRPRAAPDPARSSSPPLLTRPSRPSIESAGVGPRRPTRSHVVSERIVIG